MENFVTTFVEFLSSLKLPRFYPLIAPTVFCAAFLTLLIFGAIFKRIRSAAKSAFTISAFSSYLLTLSKIAADAASLKINADFINYCIAAVFLAGISFFLAALLTLQNLFCKKSSYRLKEENPSVDISDDLKPSIITQAFASNPFKRVEYLPTERMWNDEEKEKYGLNLNEILSYCEKIKQRRPAPAETQELDEIESDVKKYALKKISDFERRDFSDKLGFLLKLISKYEVS